MDNCYIEVEYYGQTFVPLKLDEQGYAQKNETKFGCSKTNYGEWEDKTIMSNVIVDAGTSITIRGYMNIPVETESLEEQFKLIFHLPTSSGETEDFVYVVN